MIYFTVLMLALAVGRLTRFVVKDTFPPMLWVRDQLAGGWRQLTEAERRTLSTLRAAKGAEKYAELSKTWEVHPDGEMRYLYKQAWSPFWLGELITCPWCASGWITGGLTAATDITVGLPVPWLVGLAAWMIGGWLAAKS